MRHKQRHKERHKQKKIKRYLGDGCYWQKSVSVAEMQNILKYGDTDATDDTDKPPAKVVDRPINKPRVDKPIGNPNNSPNSNPNSVLNSLLSSEGKLLKLYQESTPSKFCYTSDQSAAYALDFQLRKIQYLKARLRDKGLISYSIFDSDIEEFYFILSYR